MFPCLTACMTACLFDCLPVHLSAFIPASLFGYRFLTSLSPNSTGFIYSFVYLSVCLSIYISIFLLTPIYREVYIASSWVVYLHNRLDKAVYTSCFDDN